MSLIITEYMHTFTAFTQLWCTHGSALNSFRDFQNPKHTFLYKQRDKQTQVKTRVGIFPQQNVFLTKHEKYDEK